MTEAEASFKANPVAVARDVLQQLDLKRYKARQMLYIKTQHDEGDTNERGDFIERPVTDFIDRPCEVCAKGACVMSILRISPDMGAASNRQDVFDVNEDVGYEVFGDVWDSMESVFEHALGTAFSESGNIYSLNSDERLRIIMENVLEYDGTFDAGACRDRYLTEAKRKAELK